MERIEKVLSSDDMRGRRTFTPDIDRAADFIAGEFKKIGLQTWNNSGSYRQEFAMVRSQVISVSAELDGVILDPKNIAVNSCQTDLKVNESSGYEIAAIKAGGNFLREAFGFLQSGKNIVVLVDSSFASNFSRLFSGRRAHSKQIRVLFSC